MPSEGALLGFLAVGLILGVLLTWLAQTFLSGGAKLKKENKKLRAKLDELEEENEATYIYG